MLHLSKKIKMWADCLFCEKQTNAALRREEPVPNGEVERGALERQRRKAGLG